MKTIIRFLSAICILIITLSACQNGSLNGIRTKQNGMWLYNVDYTQRYNKTLNSMFGDNWKIKSKTEKKIVPEKLDPHVDATPYTFTEWTIQYTDANNESQEFVLNNKDELSRQIENYIETIIPNYYEKNFYSKYLKDIPLAGASYVFGFLVDTSVFSEEDNSKQAEMTAKYRKKLETPEGTICFSKFTPANAFEKCPMYLSISISIKDGSYSTLEKKTLEEKTNKQVELMIMDINKFTKNKINMDICVVSNQGEDTLYDGQTDWRWYYVQGASKVVDDPANFEKVVYNGYKGLFW